MTVLIVDDDAAMRDSLRFSLEAEGIGVEVASSAQEAVHVISQNQFDAVVTDLTMAGDGEHVMERVQVLRPETPVIVVTGHPSRARRESVVRSAYAILAKPFNPERLIKLLRKARGARRRRPEDT